MHCTELGLASFLPGGFTAIAVINPPEKKLPKRTSVHRLQFLMKCNLQYVNISVFES